MNVFSCVFCGLGGGGAAPEETGRTVAADTHQARKSAVESPAHTKPAHFAAGYDMGVKLGEGGFAIVHLATEKATGRKVAVKVVKRKNLEPKDEKALDLEHKILARMHHPNIVEAYDYFKEKDNLYVVLEYLEGGELFDRIVKKQKYTEAEARAAVVVLLTAIKFCHDKDIVHRDLKPENLLMAHEHDDADVKLADFGLATIASGNTIRDKAGTPEYIAPEIIENLPFGKPVDMWAFGVILFILLGGYQPFHEDDRKKLFAKIIGAKYHFHPKRWATVSDDAKDLITSLLEPQPAKRLTVEQALDHAWLKVPEEKLTLRAVDTTELKKFQAAKKLRVGVKALMAVNKMKAGTRIASLNAAAADADAAAATNAAAADGAQSPAKEDAASPAAAAAAAAAADENQA